jgi:integrase
MISNKIKIIQHHFQHQQNNSMGKLKSSFVLKQYSKEEKQVILYLNFGYKEYDAVQQKHSYKPLRYYTGVKVKPQEWDVDNKRPFNKSKLRELLSIEKTADDIYNYLVQVGKEITPDSLKQELDVKLKGASSENEVIRIIDFIRETILKGNSGRSKLTLREYNKLANKLEAFEEKRMIRITANNFKEELYLDFMEEIKSQMNKQNSVWAIAKTVKAVLNEISRKHKVSVFNPTTDLARADRTQKSTEDKVYLSFSQIKVILDYKPQNDRLKNTQLILVTLLFTGCRYSDVFKIIPEFEYDDGTINFRYARYIDQKTGKDIIVPILNPLEESYDLNGGNTPYLISSAKFNQYVKELVMLSGLNEDVTLSFSNSFGKKEFETKPLYEFVSSHIGRRSFITNLINYIPVTILTKITGHSLTNKNVIFSYNKISLIDNAVMFVEELGRIKDDKRNDFPMELV